MPATRQRLYINIDHVATLRQARRGSEPDPLEAARVCEASGADGITAHLREDRRHIQDSDVRALRKVIKTYFNLELACVPEMLAIAIEARPEQVTLVPERREEVTTEGGLDLSRDPARVRGAVDQLRAAGIRSALFIDPTRDAVDRSRDAGCDAIELHTGRYAHGAGGDLLLDELRNAARHAAGAGLAVHAGHGLTIGNVRAVSAIPEIEELNIGHSIVSRAVFVGLAAAVGEMKSAMAAARMFDVAPPPP
ncbi:MAG TPA: pyridoxine 5'-phosphate synthase [Gemmatimonadaceae bacterium]|nr:pyridoxine 5'-phosphate synthase [Gemmatimonadaceae bacterium]